MPSVRLIGSGSIMQQVLKARHLSRAKKMVDSFAQKHDCYWLLLDYTYIYIIWFVSIIMYIYIYIISL